MHGRINGPVYAIYYPVLAAIGVTANLVAIAILSRGRCGLSTCITRYLVSMAVSDLLVVVTAVIFNRIIGIYFPVSFLSFTSACTLSTVIIYATTESSVWLTVAFTFDRFVAVCCPDLRTRYCTERSAELVIGTVCVLSCLKSVPWFFIYEPLYTTNNVRWFCNIVSHYYTSVAWRVFDWFARILNPGLPFLFIFLFNGLTVRYILVANRSRRRLRVQASGRNGGDSETESRRKSVILLFAVSGSFILLWMTYVVNFLYVQISNEQYFTGSNFNDPRFVRQEVGNMLQLLNCCTNTCIYVATQMKFREEVKNAAKYLWQQVAALMK
ncbi:probable G-protein coupled receptor 139 [Narcine bancroftii]|uniref:probable G-protein coupled receptor 139 n=1 Tax=Narcine bancroftii TaxID=1343680 RepID=UPI0038319499